MLSDNFVLPFQLEKSSLRGRFVRLGSELDTILHRHAYPKDVGTLLGEATVIAVALAKALKYDGVFTLQIRTDGAVRLMVADVTGEGGIRSYAQFDEEKRAVAEGKLIGEGHLAFTLDRLHQEERYQGLVALEGKSLSEAVQHYFRQSEQIPTGIIAAVGQNEIGAWRGGCLMLQRMPREGGHSVLSDTGAEDDWLRAMVLMQTCTPEELTSEALAPEELLYRLFHEDGVRIYDPVSLTHKCRCSQDRVATMLKGLPQDEVEKLAVDGRVDVTCEFCNNTYSFDADQRVALYKAE